LVYDGFVRKKAWEWLKVVRKTAAKVAKVVGKMYFCTRKSILFMMLKRRIIETLQKWKEQPNHLPLVIMGIRQCGKTYISGTLQ
jgi:hypothetical protein